MSPELPAGAIRKNQSGSPASTNAAQKYGDAYGRSLSPPAGIAAGGRALARLRPLDAAGELAVRAHASASRRNVFCFHSSLTVSKCSGPGAVPARHAVRLPAKLPRPSDRPSAPLRWPCPGRPPASRRRRSTFAIPVLGNVFPSMTCSGPWWASRRTRSPGRSAAPIAIRRQVVQDGPISKRLRASRAPIQTSIWSQACQNRETATSQTATSVGGIRHDALKTQCLSGPERRRQISAEANWKLAGFTLTSISAWRDWTFYPQNDLDYLPLDIQANGGSNIWNKQASEELRVASPTGGAFDYVAGVYLYWQSVDTLTVPGPSYGSDAAGGFIFEPDAAASGLSTPSMG